MLLIKWTVSVYSSVSEKQEVLCSAVGGARASDAPSLCIADFVCARASAGVIIAFTHQRVKRTNTAA